MEGQSPIKNLKSLSKSSGLDIGKTLESIYFASIRFLEPLSAEETYQIIVNEAMKLVEADYGSIFLEEDGELKRIYASSPLLYKTKIRRKGFTYKAFKEQKAYIVGTKRVVRVHPSVKQMNIQSTIFIPLSYRKKSMGVLSVDTSKIAHFTTREFDILKLFGSLASLAIRKTQLHNETQQALETRDLFISMAAHELRTPLTTITGYIQLLHNRIPKNNSSEARWINELSWETKRLTLLVNELLEVNKIKSGAFQYLFKECNFKNIIERAISTFQFTHPDRQIIFIDQLGDKSDLIVGDFDKILQVITNFVDNAIKFSQSDTPVTLTLCYKQPQLVLAITDQGKGISRQDLPRIFEGYFRGKQQTEEGMGLGLFLAKSIIEKHHGEIHVRSKLGKGSTFEIRLPLTHP